MNDQPVSREAVDRFIDAFWGQPQGPRTRELVERSLRAALNSDPQEDGEHDVGIDCLEGGWRGYQAVCWDCGWRGPEHLRGDEEMGTEESRAHKREARADAAAHRKATPCPDCKPDTEDATDQSHPTPHPTEEPQMGSSGNSEQGEKTLPICTRCGGILGFKLDGGCTCEPSHAKTGKSITYVPLARLQAVETERDEREDDLLRANIALEANEWDRLQAQKLCEAEQQRDTLIEALRPVAELAERLAAKGHLTPDPLWQNDPDLTFPSDVELSVTDLNRAMQTLKDIGAVEGSDNA